MQVISTELADVRVITPRRFSDQRGYFCETWNRRTLADIGIDIDFVQDNESLSRDEGTLRGLHYQTPPFAQTKLVRVVAGAILDVVVDVRKGSADFGRWAAVELSAENGRQLLVPRGFLHGFLTCAPNTHVMYKVDNFYNAESDGSVIWNDPDLAIDWGQTADILLSDKDRAAPRMSDWQSPFEVEGLK